MGKNTKMSSIHEINGTDFEAEVLKSEQPVLVSFWAAWNQPSRMLGSVLDEVAAECNGRAKVVKVNVDDNSYLELWFGIQSIPTLLCFVNGEVVATITGTASKEAILAVLKPLADAIPSITEPDYQMTSSKA
jgi:thioredoxin 1